MGRKTNDEVFLLDKKKEYVFRLWNDLLLSVCISQMELLDICKFSMLEQLPNEFSPPPFPCVGMTNKQLIHRPLVTLTERAAELVELHLPISLSCFSV